MFISSPGQHTKDLQVSPSLAQSELRLSLKIPGLESGALFESLGRGNYGGAGTGPPGSNLAVPPCYSQEGRSKLGDYSAWRY